MSGKSNFLPDTGFWKNKKVLVTGGSGFLGRHICERLESYGAKLAAPRRKEYDLSRLDDALQCFATHKPEITIHSAAYYGGLGITMAEPAKIYFENLVMGANVMEAARRNNVKKFVSVGTACSYPGHLDNTLREEDLWAGPLHDSVAAYGAVKKMLAIQGMAYRKQYGFHSIHLIPSNLYGPFDCFDEYRSHVVGALIKKFIDAHRTGSEVTVWGTGKAIREFLYVEDCADGILLAAEKYNEFTSVNIGTGVGTPIKNLVSAISEVLSFKGKVVWDSSKPDGQAKKILDIEKMSKALDWTPRTHLLKGIAKTVEWYDRQFPVRKAA